MSGDEDRQKLAIFLRSRRERITPAEMGFPTGTHRRTQGLRREEVAVLAGLSPTWYTYLEQGRSINPSPEVMDSLARVLRLSEDERRYMHILAFGHVISPQPLDAAPPGDDLMKQVVETTSESPYPVYAANQYADLIAWNPATTEWYEDWSLLDGEDRNMLRWLLTSPVARERLVDWETETKDIVARWRADSVRWPTDDRLQRRIAEFCRISPEFASWWDDHDVREHRTRIRRFRHPKLGTQTVHILVMLGADFAPGAVVFHLPMSSTDPTE